MWIISIINLSLFFIRNTSNEMHEMFYPQIVDDLLWIMSLRLYSCRTGVLWIASYRLYMVWIKRRTLNVDHICFLL